MKIFIPVLATLLLTPGVALAQSDAWSDALSSDILGFSDAASTVRQGSFQAEFGIQAAKPTGQPFNTALTLTGRYGLFDGLELRIDIPSFTLIFDDSTRGVGIQTVFETIELGAKWTLPLFDAFTLSLLPHVIAPTTLGNSTTLGAGLGVLLDVPLGDTLSVTANLIPRYQNITVGNATANVFDLSATGSLSLLLSQQLSMFAEVWGTLTPGEDILPGGNVGVMFLATPELQFGLSAGVSGLPSFMGSLAAVYRWN